MYIDWFCSSFQGTTSSDNPSQSIGDEDNHEGDNEHEESTSIKDRSAEEGEKEYLKLFSTIDDNHMSDKNQETAQDTSLLSNESSRHNTQSEDKSDTTNSENGSTPEQASTLNKETNESVEENHSSPNGNDQDAVTLDEELTNNFPVHDHLTLLDDGNLVVYSDDDGEPPMYVHKLLSYANNQDIEGLYDDLPCFVYFLYHAVRIVVGKKIFTKSHKNSYYYNYCSVSDEAFAFLVLDNNSKRYFDMNNKPAPKGMKGNEKKKFWISPKYTILSGSVSCGVKGWTIEGRMMYMKYYNFVKEYRTQKKDLLESNALNIRTMFSGNRSNNIEQESQEIIEQNEKSEMINRRDEDVWEQFIMSTSNEERTKSTDESIDEHSVSDSEGDESQSQIDLSESDNDSDTSILETEEKDDTQIKSQALLRSQDGQSQGNRKRRQKNSCTGNDEAFDSEDGNSSTTDSVSNHKTSKRGGATISTNMIQKKKKKKKRQYHDYQQMTMQKM